MQPLTFLYRCNWNVFTLDSDIQLLRDGVKILVRVTEGIYLAGHIYWAVLLMEAATLPTPCSWAWMDDLKIYKPGIQMSVQKYSYLKAWLGLGLDNVQTVISKIKRNECVPGKEYKLDIRVTDAPPLTTQPPWRWIIPVIFIHGECGRLKCFLCSCRKSQKVTMDIFEPGDENNEASHRAINSATRNQAE